MSAPRPAEGTSEPDGSAPSAGVVDAHAGSSRRVADSDHRPPVADAVDEDPRPTPDGTDESPSVLSVPPDAAAVPELPHARSRRVFRHVIRATFFLSALLSVVLFALAVMAVAAEAEPWRPVLSPLFLALLFADAAGCLAIVVFDYSTHLRQARIVIVATVVAIVLTLLVDLVSSGVRLTWGFYVVQLFCLAAFHVTTDERIARNETFHSPWDVSDDVTRRSYIPLNFYNLFWVFVVASVAGLAVEVVWHALTVGGYEDRAGLVWGPFSPIYGFGAMMMTIAVNRWWNRSKVAIFLVSGAIGAAFEFAVSWVMEKAFGIVAWDYSGTFLNLQGRTNFAFFCAWGLLGLVWIRLLLPDVLRLVDAIPLRLRAVATVLMAMFMLINGFVTVVALDRWYGRLAGEPPPNAIAAYVDRTYDDAEMAQRFQSMTLDATRAERARR